MNRRRRIQAQLERSTTRIGEFRQALGVWFRVLSGEPGKTLVLARRAGQVWYVAGLNGTESPVTVKVAVPFLGEGGWNVSSISDAPGGGG